MAADIRRSAVSHYQVSLAHLYETAPAVLSDERLAQINASAYNSFEDYITDILLAGSPVQRAALLDLIDRRCDLAMPEIKMLGRAAALELISTYLLQTCQVLGCDFKGDMPTVVSTMYDSYGGLSMLDWARFFFKIQKGEYRTEYQSTNTRGLNAEFLNEWIEMLCNDRDDSIQKLRKEMPDKVSDEAPALSYEQIKEIQRGSTEVAGQVHQWRIEYEHNLTERKMEVIVVQDKLEDGTVITSEHHVPMVTDKPTAPYTRLKDFIEVFYCFDGAEPAREIIQGLMAVWELQRVVNFEDTPDKEFYRAQSKSLYNALRKFIKTDVTRVIVTVGLKSISEKHPIMSDFYQALTGKEYVGDKPSVGSANYIEQFTSKLIHEFQLGYFDNARKRLEVGAFPLYRDEFHFLCAIQWATKVAGIEHPFTKIFNIEQQ